MVFSSVTFLFFFLPIFMAAYFCTPTTYGKNLTTLAFSLIFYAWGEPRFLPLLLISAAFNFAAALVIDQCEGRARRIFVGVAITADLLLLGIFKYSGFVTENLAALLSPFGISIPTTAIALPLGISFFTFHCLSYIIDVYRHRFPANKNPIEVALYIALFPQLVAGPIVRYKTVARQLRKRRNTLALASAGARIFIIGLAQKVLVADQLADVVKAVFDKTLLPTMAEAWTGLLSYTIQIYFDFNGYSNMAIGMGLILGFTLPRNFRFPYSSLSITEFWRRWHMSLSSWLRDYLYMPLGGSRGDAAATYRNLITVFFICGLWHGAAWTFVLWGVWHGAFLVFERVGTARLLVRLPVLARWGYTILAVMGGWVLFRADNLLGARLMFTGLIGRHGIGGLSFDVHSALQPVVLLALFGGCALAVLPRIVRLPAMRGPAIAAFDGVWTFGLLFLTALHVASGAYSPFLYFRF
jgi:alginate O-acetyltransferase complex protein AlgI